MAGTNRVPLNEPALALKPDPRSVQEARRWVVSSCARLGRDDLSECAALGISELVTNALLHGEDPIAVRLRGTAEHPRVEVSDGSRKPPVMPAPSGEELDDLLATFGRGLNIVAMCSVAWGAAIDDDGKCVWFEPADSPHEELAPSAQVVHAEMVDHGIDHHGTTVVDLARVPLKRIVDMRRHYHELRRELRLLAVAHRDDYPVARELTEVFLRFEQSFPPTATTEINDALARGAATVDLRVGIDPDSSTVIEQMLDLLDLADDFCRAKRLLSLARTPSQRAFQQWYFGEFVRQARGESPRAWAPGEPGTASAS
jgi:hypothetical protein